MQIKIDKTKLLSVAVQLQAYKDKKIAVLSAECRRVILSGFESEVLGDRYWYPSLETDQLNLAASVTESLLPDIPVDWKTSFWCADEDGVWALRAHNAVQIQQLGREAKARILRLMHQNSQLSERVAQAGDYAGVDNINWNEPAA